MSVAWFDAAGAEPSGAVDRFWAGHRIYLAFDGTKLIILLGGGTKTRQQADIDQAERWADYKRRKKAAKE